MGIATDHTPAIGSSGKSELVLESMHTRGGLETVDRDDVQDCRAMNVAGENVQGVDVAQAQSDGLADLLGRDAYVADVDCAWHLRRQRGGRGQGMRAPFLLRPHYFQA